MLELQHITKRFSKRLPPALDDLSFSVAEGEIFGLLGHNGAGKSTALGTMLGMVRPDKGEVQIEGVSVQTSPSDALRKVGAIFESPSFYDYMSGWDNLRFFTSLSGFWDKDAVADVLDLVGLEKRIHSKVNTYSHGMRQRLGLAQALLPSPKLLLLDEPTDGLDPEGIREFRELVLRLRNERGITIVFNSHLLSEVEQVCDRFAILRGGKLVYEGSASDFESTQERYKLQVDDTEKARDIIATFDGVLEVTEESATALLPSATDPADIIQQLVTRGVRVSEFAHRPQTLEELYIDVAHKNS